jgi:hypothetical protein
MLDWIGGHGSITGERTINTLFRDVLLVAFGAVAAVLVIVLFMINPPKEDDAENSRSRGNMRVEVYWPPDIDADVDLWSQAPGDVPVGYSNLNGRVFNLVRDDLGSHADLSGVNYEVSFTRGIPPGEYIINLHWYSNAQGAARIPVKVLITLKKDDGAASKEAPTKVLTKTVMLTMVGKEVTIIRFNVDDNMDIIEDSFTSIFKPIRAFDDDGHDGA